MSLMTLMTFLCSIGLVGRVEVCQGRWQHTPMQLRSLSSFSLSQMTVECEYVVVFRLACAVKTFFRPWFPLRSFKQYKKSTFFLILSQNHRLWINILPMTYFISLGNSKVLYNIQVGSNQLPFTAWKQEERNRDGDEDRKTYSL